MVLDFFATFFSSANKLMPLFVRDVLHVGVIQYGWLSAAQSIGAVSAALVISQMPVIRRQGPLFLVSVVSFGMATILFGLSRSFLLAMAALILVGASDSVSTIIRNTIRQLQTPDHIRGRMTGVNQIFFMGGPQLGEVEAGVVAQLFSTPIAIVSGGMRLPGSHRLDCPALAAGAANGDEAAREAVTGKLGKVHMPGLTEQASNETIDPGAAIGRAHQAWEGSMLRQLEELLAVVQQSQPETLAFHSGMIFERDSFRFNYWNCPISLSWPDLEAVYLDTGKASPVFDLTLFLFYLKAADGAELADRWISLRSCPEAHFTARLFKRYSGDRLAQALGINRRFPRLPSRRLAADLIG
jgi:hypothetical protein